MSDTEIGDVFSALRAESRAKRARNRDSSRRLLDERDIPYTAHNEGLHLVVGGSVDFWPGTGLWKVRHSNQQGRGVRHLINYWESTQPRDEKSLG